MTTVTFSGQLVSGRGEGAGFTRAPWAREAFLERLGIDPWPGTLNLTVEDARSRAAWDRVRGTPGIRLPAPEPGWCDARCWPVRIAGREAGAVVLPEVAGYPPDQVEIVAAAGLRRALGLSDGDTVRVEVELSAAEPPGGR